MITPKPSRLERPTYPYNEVDAQKASDLWGCNCGPGALATMLNLKPDDVRPFLTDFDQKRYTNPTMMKGALKALGVTVTNATRDRSGRFTEYGLVRVQWDGPWCNPGVPPRVAYRQTHWIGAMRHNDSIFVFDINSGWTSVQEWESNTVPDLAKMNPKSNGKWFPTHQWEIAI